MSNITILLVDDHAVVRDGLRYLLEAQPGFTVNGDAANGREAIRQISARCPDIVILDIAMPELNGIEAMQQIRQICPASRMIILSMHATTEHVSRALLAGARGYLLKESAGQELIQAVRAVHAGQRHLSQKVSNMVVDDYINQVEVGKVVDPLDRLSPRERETLQLVVEGKSSVEIADILGLSPKTVETYRSHLMQKLGINDLPSLVKFAIQQGLTPLQ